MPVYRLAETCIEPLPETDFAACGVKERGDLQRLLRANVSVVAPDVMVIAEEFGEWEESKRRIDLLGVDRSGNLVVIELKRDDDAHMDASDQVCGNGVRNDVRARGPGVRRLS